MLVEKQLFKQFADLMRLPVNFVVVYTQFGNATGIVNRGGDCDFLFKQWHTDGPSSDRSSLRAGTLTGRVENRTGMVVRDAAMLFQSKHLPAISEKVRLISPVERSVPRTESHQRPELRSRDK